MRVQRQRPADNPVDTAAAMEAYGQTLSGYRWVLAALMSMHDNDHEATPEVQNRLMNWVYQVNIPANQDSYQAAADIIAEASRRIGEKTPAEYGHREHRFVADTPCGCDRSAEFALGAVLVALHATTCPPEEFDEEVARWAVGYAYERVSDRDKERAAGHYRAALETARSTR